LFYGTFWPTRVVFDPFLDGFLTVHFIMIFVIVGFVSLARAYPWIASNKIHGSSPLRFVGLLGEITRSRGLCWTTKTIVTMAVVDVDPSRYLKSTRVLVGLNLKMNEV
jgi:hypothetical protein